MTTILQESVDMNVTEHVRTEDANNPTMAHYTRELNRIGLWPPSKVFRECTVAQLLNRFRQFRNCQGYRGCKCCDSDLSSKFRNVADDLLFDLSGLCLACVKNGKLTDSEGNCGVNNESACKG